MAVRSKHKVSVSCVVLNGTTAVGRQKYAVQSIGPLFVGDYFPNNDLENSEQMNLAYEIAINLEQCLAREVYEVREIITNALLPSLGGGE